MSFPRPLKGAASLKRESIWNIWIPAFAGMTRGMRTEYRATMIIIPAIDLKDHQVVRLSQGKMGQSKVYSDDPVVVAQRWVDAGAQRLHLVDLNGAFEGHPIHFKEVSKITRTFPDLQVEIGGGIRTIETIEQYFENGVSYCILGTAALKNPDVLVEACVRFPQKIILGIDAKMGMVATEGWDNISRFKAVDIVKKFADFSISEIIYTDVAKDGMLSGMNFPGIRNMAKSSPFPIIASGGFTQLSDVEELEKISNVCGVIAGKALYEGLVDLGEAIRLASVAH